MKVFSIGRSSQCDVVLQDPTVSRRHAEITELGSGNFLFVDLGSTSGSYMLEGGSWQPISRATLSGGDWVRVGDVEGRLSDLLGPRFRPGQSVVVERDPATGQIEIRTR